MMKGGIFEVDILPLADTLTGYENMPVSQRGNNVRVPSSGIIGQAVTSSASTAYTFVLGDSYKQFTSGASVTATIPPFSSVAFPLGKVLTMEQNGAGVVTWTAGSGVTINSNGSLVASNGQYAVSSAVKVGTNTWTLMGNLA